MRCGACTRGGAPSPRKIVATVCVKDHMCGA